MLQNEPLTQPHTAPGSESFHTHSGPTTLPPDHRFQKDQRLALWTALGPKTALTIGQTCNLAKQAVLGRGKSSSVKMPLVCGLFSQYAR